MKVAKHENVRLMVSQLLLNIFKKILEIKIKFAPDDLRLNILKSFMEYFKDKPTQVILLMPQEIRISQEDRYRIDTVFEKIIAFDFKSYPNEFDEAYHNAINKRINLFLRWVVRDEYPDLGIWRNLDKSKLLIPLGNEIARVAGRVFFERALP